MIKYHTFFTDMGLNATINVCHTEDLFSDDNYNQFFFFFKIKMLYIYTVSYILYDINTRYLLICSY